MINNIVIGAGISGLSFGYFSKKPFIIFEKENCVGGLCKSIKDNGFTFDYSGHFIHIKDKKIKTLIEKLTDKKLLTVKRNSVILFNNKIMPFPFQANLYYLSEQQKKKCVEGIKKRKNIKIYDDMPFIDWAKAMFGNGITEYFMQPYNQKLWNYNLKKLTAAWTAPFVPKPAKESIISSAYKQNNQKYGYNSVFYYPQKNGCQAMIDGFYKKLKNNIITNAKVETINLKSKTVFADNKYYFYDNIISTQPLKELLLSIKDLPENISKLINKLECTETRCVNLGIKYKKSLPKMIKNVHWIYIPETKYPFYRVGIYSNVTKSLVPKNCYSLYVEMSDIKNCDNIIPVLKQTGIMNDDDEVVSLNAVDIKYAYVIFNKERKKVLDTIFKFLKDNNIYCTGRYGSWEYSFIEKNIVDGKKLATELNKKK
ncbi:MAG: FAD-dependent oxidoreductase [Elusimicrobia bacterium]|nr:FAD-dependent oxidoreductase [Elusimicrobiota bacterium]